MLVEYDERIIGASCCTIVTTSDSASADIMARRRPIARASKVEVTTSSFMPHGMKSGRSACHEEGDASTAKRRIPPVEATTAPSQSFGRINTDRIRRAAIGHGEAGGENQGMRPCRFQCSFASTSKVIYGQNNDGFKYAAHRLGGDVNGIPCPKRRRGILTAH